MELFNSIGIELEIEDIRGDSLNGLNDLGLTIHRDASCESDGYSLMGMKVNIEESDKEIVKYLPINRNTYGCELVTRGTLDTSSLEYLYKLKRITNLLLSRGESSKSYRAGFHVHVNVAYNLQILKSILRLSRHLEQVLYLLGGMGYDYRGFKNDSAYCRPITKYGPVCVKTGWGTFSQVFSISDLLKSKTTSEFKVMYGNIDRLRGSHFIPIRYHGINLLSLFTQGSLEFRMFNKSTNPYYLMAIIEFCKAFSEYSVQSSFKSLKDENLLKENSIFDVKGEQNKDYIINTFTHFLSLSNLESREVTDTLYEILQNSSVDSLVIPNEYVYSHLMFHRQGQRSPIHWENEEYKPKVIKEDIIKIPKFEDIHVLREQENIQMPPRRYGRNIIENLDTLLQIREGGNRNTQDDENQPQQPTTRTNTTGNFTANIDWNQTARTARINPQAQEIDPPEDTEDTEDGDEIRGRYVGGGNYVNANGRIFRRDNDGNRIETAEDGNILYLNDGNYVNRQGLIFRLSRNGDRVRIENIPRKINENRRNYDRRVENTRRRIRNFIDTGGNE